MSIYLIMIFSYFLGSIPFAYIITRFMTGKDVRKIGSGNVGATNASRVMGVKYGLLVGIFDILKGFLAVTIAQLLLPGEASYLLLLASLLAIIGHNWSIFLKFTGGKGVATTFGVLLKLLPVVFIFYVVIWLLVVIITRYISLASILGALFLPVLVYIFRDEPAFIYFAMALALLIIIRHHSNIRRLIKGTESRFRWPSNSSAGGSR